MLKTYTDAYYVDGGFDKSFHLDQDHVLARFCDSEAYGINRVHFFCIQDLVTVFTQQGEGYVIRGLFIDKSKFDPGWDPYIKTRKLECQAKFTFFFSRNVTNLKKTDKTFLNKMLTHSGRNTGRTPPTRFQKTGVQ